jgi:hypothetical protein
MNDSRVQVNDRVERVAPNASVQSTHALPPLRIHHLMAWMATTALLISGCIWFDRMARNGPPITDPVTTACLILGAIAISAALTVFLLTFLWRRKGCAFPQSPGDLLLIIAAKSALYVFGAFAGIFVVFFTIGDDDWQGMYFFLVVSIAAVGWIQMNKEAYSQYADTTAWRIAFAMMISAPAVVLLMAFLGTLPVVLLAALIACIVGAAGSDLCQHVNREWTHWVGVFVLISLTAALIGIFGR